MKSKTADSKPGYEINQDNQLVIRRQGKLLVIDGKPAVDRDNRLIYWLNEPLAWRRKNYLGSKLAFSGRWFLTPNYDLGLELSKRQGEKENKYLIFKGEIISVQRDALAFQIKSIDKQGVQQIQLLKLSGTWQADESNQIVFSLERKTVTNTLVFKGAWQLNQNQQISYTYEKTELKRKTKVLKKLEFEGFWQIGSQNKLRYILSSGQRSAFEFRVQLESPNLYPKDGVIKYRIGIGVRRPQKSILLYGSWKFYRNLGLVFEMEYGKDKIQRLVFGTELHLDKNNQVSCVLTNHKKEPLGMAITFTHKFLENLDAETSLRLKKSYSDTGIEAGVGIRF